jgi:hypothetical protein
VFSMYKTTAAFADEYTIRCFTLEDGGQLKKIKRNGKSVSFFFKTFAKILTCSKSTQAPSRVHF